MTENETYGGPLFVPEIDADASKIQTDQAARILAEPGFPITRASAYFRNLAAAGLIHPYSRQPSGKRAYYFRPDQLVIAAVLSRMSEAGIAGEKQRHSASLALSAWNDKDLAQMKEESPLSEIEGVPRSPAMWALVEHMSGKRNLSFEQVTLHSNKSGQKTYSSRVRSIDPRIKDDKGKGTNFISQPEGWVRRSVFALDLSDVLSHLTRAREVEN
jgi:hypothetical protein